MSDRIATTFNSSRANRGLALDICKGFDRVWHAGLLRRLNFGSDIWPFFFSFLSNRHLQMVLDGKSLLHKNI